MTPGPTSGNLKPVPFRIRHAGLSQGVDRGRALFDTPLVGSYANYIVQTVVTLVAVCAIAFVILYGARRLGIGRPRGPISLVGLLPLDARRSIYLVKVAEQVIVVGASEAGFTKLGELAATDVPAEAPAPPLPFADVLSRAFKKR